jgi:hypothetical protein
MTKRNFAFLDPFALLRDGEAAYSLKGCIALAFSVVAIVSILTAALSYTFGCFIWSQHSLELTRLFELGTIRIPADPRVFTALLLIAIVSVVIVGFIGQRVLGKRSEWVRLIDSANTFSRYSYEVIAGFSIKGLVVQILISCAFGVLAFELAVLR